MQQIACKGRWPFPSPHHPRCFSSLSLFFSLTRQRVMAHSYLLSAWRAAAECFWLDERLLMLISPSHLSRQDGLTAGGGNVFHCQENLMVHGILHFSRSLTRSLILSPARTKTENLITVITDFPQPKSNEWNMVCIQSAHLFNMQSSGCICLFFSQFDNNYWCNLIVCICVYVYVCVWYILNFSNLIHMKF